MKNLSDLTASLSNFESVYKSTNYYRWKPNLGEPGSAHIIDEAKHLIIAFRIVQIPEFNEIIDSNANDKFVDCLLRQKIFIDTVNNVFLTENKGLTATLELRITNNPKTKLIETYILLRLVLTTKATYYDPVRLKKEFKQLIPDDYLVEELDDDLIADLIKLDNKKLVEIRKKGSFLPVGAVYQSDEKIIAHPEMVNWDGKSRLYIPCVSYVEPKTHNLSNLYKILQNSCERVHIRISLGAVSLTEEEKNLSLQYYNMLNSTYANVNSADINNNKTAFTKFIVAETLFSVKMQVAAQSEVTAISVANAFCGQLAFGDFKSQPTLQCIPISNFNADSTTQKDDWEECNHCFYPYLSSENIETFEDMDETVNSYIHRSPYISDGNEAMALFRLPIASASGLPGLIAKPVKPFYQPNPKNSGEPEIDLGRILTSTGIAGSGYQPKYSIPVSDLTKHGLIVGATGSGKTNTTLVFLQELIEKDIPFLMIEPVKSEYYKQLKPLLEKKGKKLHRFDLSRPRLTDGSLNLDFLRFNPFVPQVGINTMQHLSYIKSCFMAAFPMYGIMPLVLEDCLYEFFKMDKLLHPEYKQQMVIKPLTDNDFFDPERSTKYWMKKKLIDGTVSEINQRGRTMVTFSGYVSQYLKDNERLFDAKIRTELEGGLSRRFTKLTKGLLGQVMCPERWCGEDGLSYVPDNLTTLLNESCIVELEALPENEDKALIMAFLLTYLFENRQLRVSHDATNQLHITLIEEAHRLLSSSSVKSGGGENASQSQDGATKTISLFIDMLAEIRAKNEGIFIIEQSPTKLVTDAIKNTNLKIMHRLTNKSDRDYLGESMNMEADQSRYATTLQKGEALIFEEQLDKPVLVKIKPFTK
jgi:hypothetical protein